MCGCVCNIFSFNGNPQGSKVGRFYCIMHVVIVCPDSYLTGFACVNQCLAMTPTGRTHSDVGLLKSLISRVHPQRGMNPLIVYRLKQNWILFCGLFKNSRALKSICKMKQASFKAVVVSAETDLDLKTFKTMTKQLLAFV